MNLEQLRLIAQIAEHGSLTKAAIAANTQQSAISRQLSAMESECGGRLFYRTGRGVTLTELGLSMMPRIKQLLLDADRLSEDMKAQADTPSGDVRLGILPALANPLVTLLFAQLRSRYSGVRLHLFEGSNGQLEEWLASGRIDLGLLYRYGEVDASNERELGRVPACLIGAAGDSVTRQPVVAFETLCKLPLVVPSEPNALRSTLDKLARQINQTLNVVLEADSLPIQKSIVATGAAYAIVGRLAVTEELAAGTLQAAQIADPVIERAAVLGRTTHHLHTRAMRAVADLIEPLVGDLLAP
jgi:DNA-binding transcriptional LysR family regulator